MIRSTMRQPTYRNVKVRAALGSCCSSCAEHAAGNLAAVTCDQDNNCYDDVTGIFTPAPAFSASASLTANLNSAKTWLSQNSIAVPLAVIAGIVVAMASGGGGRRR